MPPSLTTPAPLRPCRARDIRGCCYLSRLFRVPNPGTEAEWPGGPRFNSAGWLGAPALCGARGTFTANHFVHSADYESYGFRFSPHLGVGSL